MTEDEWLTSGIPEELLAHEAIHSTRKLRLFALACCERIDHLITDPRSRAALEFAARHVGTPINRQKGRTEIEKAARGAWSDLYNEMLQFADHRMSGGLVRSNAADAAAQTMSTDARAGARYTASFACFAVAWGVIHAGGKSAFSSNLSDEVKAPEFAQQVLLLRDIFGNPFRPVAVDPTWLTSDVRALAVGIYDERAFDRMPILADALQDAGCDSDDVLNHCRTPGPHARGCWVVDLLLGKA